MKIQIKKEIWIWLIILVPFITFAVMQSRLPENLPSHFDANGRANGYMHPGQFMLFTGGLNILLYLLLLFIPRIDPKRMNYDLFRKAYYVIRLSIHLLLATIICLTLLYSVGNHINITKIIFLIMLFFFIVLGNYLGNVRPNWFVGIRTPWTLSNETVWRKTHQLAGKLLFFAALAGFVIALFLNIANPVFIILPVVTIGLIIPVIYSYFEYKKVTNNSASNQ